MFGVMHPSRKYSPTQYLAGLCPSTVSAENTLPNSQVDIQLEESPEKMSPPPNAKMRNSKAKGMRAIKRNSSPTRSLEAVEEPCNETHHEKGLIPAERGGVAARSRKKGYRPPDVRTIFEPPEKDPRVPEEKGEGHSFCTDVSGAWCDLCCDYIFQSRLTCTGCKYTCHPQCRSKVSLDCHHSGPATESQDHLNNNNRNPSAVSNNQGPETEIHSSANL